MPESGLGWLVCSKFARQRMVAVLVSIRDERTFRSLNVISLTALIKGVY